MILKNISQFIIDRIGWESDTEIIPKRDANNSRERGSFDVKMWEWYTNGHTYMENIEKRDIKNTIYHHSGEANAVIRKVRQCVYPPPEMKVIISPISDILWSHLQEKSFHYLFFYMIYEVIFMNIFGKQSISNRISCIYSPLTTAKDFLKAR